MSPAEIALRIIVLRRWRNGYLIDLARRALSGAAIHQSDTACTDDEWRRATEATDVDSRSDERCVRRATPHPE